MLKEKIQSFSIGLADESPIFVIPVSKEDNQFDLRAFFSAFNIDIKGHIYHLLLSLVDEENNEIFKHTYNLNTENSSFVAKNIINGTYGSTGYQFGFQTALQANKTYTATLQLLTQRDEELSSTRAFFNTIERK